MAAFADGKLSELGISQLIEIPISPPPPKNSLKATTHTETVPQADDTAIKPLPSIDYQGVLYVYLLFIVLCTAASLAMFFAKKLMLSSPQETHFR